MKKCVFMTVWWKAGNPPNSDSRVASVPWDFILLEANLQGVRYFPVLPPTLWFPLQSTRPAVNWSSASVWWCCFSPSIVCTLLEMSDLLSTEVSKAWRSWKGMCSKLAWKVHLFMESPWQAVLKTEAGYSKYSSEANVLLSWMREPYEREGNWRDRRKGSHEPRKC